MYLFKKSFIFSGMVFFTALTAPSKGTIPISIIAQGAEMERQGVGKVLKDRGSQDGKAFREFDQKHITGPVVKAMNTPNTGSFGLKGVKSDGAGSSGSSGSSGNSHSGESRGGTTRGDSSTARGARFTK